MLIPIWGILGAAITTTLSYLFMYFYSYFVLKKKLLLKKLNLKIILILVPSILFTLGILYLPSFTSNTYVNIVLKISISGLIYVCGIFSSNLIDLKKIKETLKLN